MWALSVCLRILGVWILQRWRSSRVKTVSGRLTARFLYGDKEVAVVCVHLVDQHGRFRREAVDFVHVADRIDALDSQQRSVGLKIIDDKRVYVFVAPVGKLFRSFDPLTYRRDLRQQNGPAVGKRLEESVKALRFMVA